MSNEVAKPCPFCGSDDLWMGSEEKEGTVYPIYVYCDNCGCRGPFAFVETTDPMGDKLDDNRKRAIEVWNKIIG